MKVDLLVVNYNTKDKLKRMFDTLHADAGDDPPWNLYVADNGSSDGSFDWLKSVRDQYRIEIVFKNPNAGYSSAINAMSACSESDVLCAVNADTWFTTHHVAQAIQTFQDNPNQAVMGPKQMDENAVIRHGGIFWDGDKHQPPSHRGWNVYDPDDVLHKDRQQCWTVSGSIYYVRRSVWDIINNWDKFREVGPTSIGIFLNKLFMYYEETLVSVMMGHLGYEVWYDGTIETAGHSWHASNKPGQNVGHFGRSKEIYKRACAHMGLNCEV